MMISEKKIEEIVDELLNSPLDLREFVIHSFSLIDEIERLKKIVKEERTNENL